MKIENITNCRNFSSYSDLKLHNIIKDLERKHRTGTKQNQKILKCHARKKYKWTRMERFKKRKLLACYNE